MMIQYEGQALRDLMNLDKFQVHMLLDMFESNYRESKELDEGWVFKTGPFRILFVQVKDIITVLRIIK